MKKHFRVAKESMRYTWPRVLCGARGPQGKARRKRTDPLSELEPVRVRDQQAANWNATAELRENATVSCAACMVVKDVWLEQPKRKPFTIRRAREVLKARGLKTP